MQTGQLIPANEFCTHYNVEISFIHSLNEFGLIEITTVEETHFIDVSQLKEIEQIVHLHYDLNINLEGIEAITHLLERVRNMQEELMNLKNKIRFYERD